MKACCKTSESQESRSRRLPFALIAIGALVALVATVALSSESSAQGEHSHGGQKSGELPASYAAAVQAIDARLKNIERLIDTKKLDAVHAEAEVVRDVAKGLAQLALKPDSGVPKEAVKEINVAAKALADKFEPIDAAGDSGNLEGTKKIYQEMVALQATLKKHGPQLASAHYAVDVKPAAPLQAGKPATLLFAIKDSQGVPVKNLETVHESAMHVLIVSKDLSWFADEHPAIQADGTFKLAFAFPAPGEYVLFHDFTPPAAGQQIVQVPVTVPGQAAAPVALKVDTDKPKLIEGYSVKFSTKGPLRTEEESELVFEITKDGQPVMDLQPHAGAMGHIVVISQDLKSVVHTHSHEESEEAGHSHGGKGESGGEHGGKGEGGEHGGHGAKPAAAASSGPDIRFHAHFQAPGLYKGWAQFQTKGKNLTVPFVMDVKAASDAPGKEGGGHKH